MSKLFTKLYSRMVITLTAFLAVLAIVTGSIALLSNASDTSSDIWDGTASSFTDRIGAGLSKDDPHIITNGKQLKNLANLVNAGDATYNIATRYFKLGNDIWLNNTELVGNWIAKAPANTWVPIGTAAQPFKAHFDGDGYTVYGVYTNASTPYTGLFGNATGTIANFTMSESYIRGGTGALNSYCGGAVGRTTNTLVNVNVENSYVKSGNAANGTVASSSAEAVAGGVAYSGGVVGYSTALIQGCASSSVLEGGNGGAGGAGLQSSSYLRNPAAGGATYTGGIVGYSTSNVVDSVNSGKIFGGTGGVGGTGYSAASSSTNEHGATSGAVGGNAWVGGITGFANLSNCINSGAVSGGTGGTGGIGGTSSGSSTIAYYYCAGAGGAAGFGYAGGLAGQGTVTGGSNTGKVDGGIGGLGGDGGAGYSGNGGNGGAGIAGGIVAVGSATDSNNRGAVSGGTGGKGGNGTNGANCSYDSYMQYVTSAGNPGAGGNGTVAGIIGSGSATRCINIGAVSGAKGGSSGTPGIPGYESGYAARPGPTASTTGISYGGGVVGSGTAIMCSSLGSLTIIGGNGGNGMYGANGVGSSTAKSGSNGGNGGGGAVGGSVYVGGIVGNGTAVGSTSSGTIEARGGHGGSGNYGGDGSGGSTTYSYDCGNGGVGGNGGAGGIVYAGGIVGSGTALNSGRISGAIIAVSGNGGAGGRGGNGGNGTTSSSASYNWRGSGGAGGNASNGGQVFVGGIAGATLAAGDILNSFAISDMSVFVGTGGAGGAGGSVGTGYAHWGSNGVTRPDGTAGIPVVGGILGYVNVASTVANNYYAGEIKSTAGTVGLIAGNVANSSVKINNCFALKDGDINLNLPLVGTTGTFAPTLEKNTSFDNSYQLASSINSQSDLLGTLNYWVANPTKAANPENPYPGWIKSTNGVPMFSAAFHKNYEYTIVYDFCGGYGNATQLTVYYGDRYQLTVPYRDGYRFLGWYSAPKGGIAYTNDTGASISNWKDIYDLVLYAQWLARDFSTYRIRFETNGGNYIDRIDVMRDSSLSEYAPEAPVREHYIFDGWYKEVDLINVFDFSVESHSFDDIIIYAKWKPEQYNIIYNLNGRGTAPLGPLIHTYGTETSLVGVVPQNILPNQTFFGWSLTNGGEIVTSIPATEANPQLWASWVFNVRLNKNGGEGGDDTVVVAYGISMPIIELPTRTGYTFEGYFDTMAPTGGTQYYTSVGESARSWNRAGDANLWARWTANDYFVYLDKNGGFGGTDSISVIYDSVLPKITAPSLEGLFFVGYFDTMESTGGKRYYTAAGESNVTWDKTLNYLTLWARWSTVGECSITFNTNGGSSINSVKFSTDDIDLTELRPVDPTRVGHVFAGWYKDELLTLPFDFSAPAPNSNVILYADWTLRTSMVTLNNNGITTTFDYTYGEPYPEAPPSDLFRKDCTFDGWFHLSELIDETNWGSFLDNLTSSVTLYAMFTPYPVITLISNGVTIGTIIIPPNSDMTEYIPNIPTRVGYTFEGWYKEAVFVNRYVFEDEESPTRDLNIYASWKPKKYTVVYDFDGGSHPTATTSSAEWGKNFVFVVPSRAHYHFAGWYTLGGKQLTPNTGNSSDIWTIDSNTDTVMVRAHWTPVDYIISFDTDGGNAVSSVSFGYGEKIDLERIPLNPSRQFALFVGWYTPEGVEFDFHTDSMPAGGVRLKAKWAADVSLLVQLIQNFQGYLNPSDFNADLHKDFLDAMQIANQVINSSEPTVEQVRTAFNNLSAAATALEKDEPVPSDFNGWIFIIIGGMIMLGGAAVLFFVVKRKEQSETSKLSLQLDESATIDESKKDEQKKGAEGNKKRTSAKRIVVDETGISEKKSAEQAKGSSVKKIDEEAKDGSVKKKTAKVSLTKE